MKFKTNDVMNLARMLDFRYRVWFKEEFCRAAEGIRVHIIYYEGLPQHTEIECEDEDAYIWHKLRWKALESTLDPDNPNQRHVHRERDVDPKTWEWEG